MDGCNNFSGWLPMWNQCCGVTLENDVIIGWFYFTYICFNELSISATASMAFNPLLPKKKKKEPLDWSYTYIMNWQEMLRKFRNIILDSQT